MKRNFMAKKVRVTKCDHPECAALDAKRIDIKNGWFSGDAIVLRVCKEHSKEEHRKTLLGTEKAQRQMA